MMKFGHFYLEGRFTLYDVYLEQRDGKTMFVASLSEDPNISFASMRADNAVQALKDYLENQARVARRGRVAWAAEPALDRRAV